MADSDQVEMDAICRMETHTKIYTVKIEKYSLTKGLTTEMCLQLGTFHLAELFWGVLFYPKGRWSYESNGISFSLKLLSETSTAVVADFEFSILDPNKRWFSEAKKNQGCYTKQGDGFGLCFMNRTHLEASEYLKDDCLTIKLHLTVTKPFRVDAKRKQVIVPSSDLQQNFGELLESGEGADIMFTINEETFIAHKCVLAARSPVFKAQLFGLMMESKMDSLKIKDLRADVFKVMLQFIYKDMLPAEVGSYEMALHLLVAADRYGLERLKVICEKKLCDSLDVKTAANTLVLAEQHNCRQLKDVCIDFVASRDLLDDVMETDGFKDLMSFNPSLLKEILDKVHSSRKI
jgi:speckle-type POZ protein